MSLIVLYILHSTSVLSFYIDVVLKLSILLSYLMLLAMHGVLQKSGKFMKWKYMASLCSYGWGYNAWPTRRNISSGRNTLHVPLSSFLPSDKRLWNSYLRSNSIGFDNSRCMWELIVYRGATLYPLCHRTDLGAKVWFVYGPRWCWVSATAWSIYMTQRI